jgi:hypothetical protein
MPKVEKFDTTTLVAAIAAIIVVIVVIVLAICGILKTNKYLTATNNTESKGFYVDPETSEPAEFTQEIKDMIKCIKKLAWWTYGFLVAAMVIISFFMYKVFGGLVCAAYAFLSVCVIIIAAYFIYSINDANMELHGINDAFVCVETNTPYYHFMNLMYTFVIVHAVAIVGLVGYCWYVQRKPTIEAPGQGRPAQQQPRTPARVESYWGA